MEIKKLYIVFIIGLFLINFPTFVNAQSSSGSIVITSFDGTLGVAAGDTYPAFPGFLTPGQTINIQIGYNQVGVITF